MEINHSYWEENSNIQHLKYESCNSNDGEHSRLKDEPLYRCCDSNLNFATVACSEDDSEFSQYKKNKVSRQDPMSHRIIEKRRRDRMNNCLADLSRLIPAEYLKKGRGRIEKTEIIEMAIRHIKYLQQAHRNSGRENSERTYGREQYRLGYQECMSETMRFLVEVEGYFAREALCVRLINHLQKHCENLIVRERVNDDTKIHMENEYSQLQIPTVQLNNGINSTPIQQLRASPMRQMPEAFGNVSQLRDMLSNNHVKDESRLLLNSQVIQPNSPSNVREEAATNLTRLPSPRHEKQQKQQQQHQHQQQQQQHQHHHQQCDQYKNVIQEHLKNPQELNNISKERERTISENENYSNGVSLYKFKNNIKQRFSQDLNAEIYQNNKFCNNKRRKITVDLTRRNSVTTETYSSENQSSPMDGSQCSPPSSELYRISSESENARISPTGSSVSDNRQNYRYSHIKIENNSQKNSNGYERYSPNVKQSSASQSDMEKSNFSVPIFALHAKGSFYIPLTIDYQTLVPYLQHNNILDMLPNVHNIILHPVTINVNFQSNMFSNSKSTVAKSNKHKIDGQNGWH